jgi:hypothetical protein
MNPDRTAQYGAPVGEYHIITAVTQILSDGTLTKSSYTAAKESFAERMRRSPRFAGVPCFRVLVDGKFPR